MTMTLPLEPSVFIPFFLFFFMKRIRQRTLVPGHMLGTAGVHVPPVTYLHMEYNNILGTQFELGPFTLAHLSTEFDFVSRNGSVDLVIGTHMHFGDGLWVVDGDACTFDLSVMVASLSLSITTRLKPFGSDTSSWMN